MFLNYYEILGIEFNASNEEIKKAFRLKAVQFHPDKHFGDNYFTSKFLEAKQASETLLDPIKKAEYDKIYKEKHPNESINKKDTTKAKHANAEEEKFHFDPYKPFYSNQDRTQQQTFKVAPRLNHWGELISVNVDFFKFPEKIGKIISGYSTLEKDMRPWKFKERLLLFLKYFLIGLGFSIFIIFAFKIDELAFITLIFLVPVIASVFLTQKMSAFTHICNFIGVNGFAEFIFERNSRNSTKGFEVNFNEVTDLVKFVQIQYQNFVYQKTVFSFIWFKEEEIIKKVDGEYYSKEDNPPRHQKTSYWLNNWAERYWTVYLLDNMQKELDNTGYLEFKIYNYEVGEYIQKPFIKLGIGYIEFIKGKEDIKYNFNEIKRVYIKNNTLFIEHKNYEKIYLFLGKGNKNGIPLTNLSNRQFFFKALELLLGYKFN